MCEKAPSILPGERICDDCRKILAKTSLLPPSTSSFDPDSNTAISPPSDEEFRLDTCDTESLTVVNQCLDTIGDTPLTKRKLQGKKDSKENVENITTMLQKVVIGGVDLDPATDDGEIIKQLKEKFSTAGRSEKIQILSLAKKLVDQEG